MRKSLLALVALIGLCVPARSQITNAQAVKIVVPYKTSCSLVTVGTTATELTGNTTTISTTAGISAIKIVNLSSTANIYSSQSANVATSGSNTGDPLMEATSATAQPNWSEYGISVLQTWYAIASAASTSIIVCLVR